MKTPANKSAQRKGRMLKDEELAIWRQVERTVVPLHPRQTFQPEPAPDSAVANAASKAATGKNKKRTAFAAVPAARLPDPPPKQPAISGLNRRDTQKLARGNVSIDGRIDLHGMSVERGRIALLNFIESARIRGDRTVLVITGKGASPFTRHTLHSTDVYHAPERQGRLRAELPNWMRERVFAEHVVGFQPAHPRHGGGGAFYVRLRRKAGRQ
jgi:DNA-nicking Smr family endonuclease